MPRQAFDGAPSDATARVFGYEPHARRIGNEKLNVASGDKSHPARAELVPRDLRALGEAGRQLCGAQ